MNDDFGPGLIIGMILMGLVWVASAAVVEDMKVNDGYLTYKSKTYTVTLYDELTQPPKPEKPQTETNP